MMMRILSVALVLIAGCSDGGLVPNPRVLETGMLLVLDRCLIEPWSCPPKYSLWDQDFQSYLPLVGPIDGAHDGLLVSVHGELVDFDRSDRNESRQAISVAEYTVHTSVHYREFLAQAAPRYTQQIYGCELGWHRSFSWAMRRDVPKLIVRLTDRLSNSTPHPFVEFGFDGRTGDFLWSDDNLDGQSPCEQQLSN
jgi:hypothetical protein